MSKGAETTTQTVQAPRYVSDQMRRTFNRADAFQPDVYQGDRIAPMNADQQAFMDRAREYSSQPFEAPQIDTSALQGALGQTINTAGMQNMMGQRADMGGLQAISGQRADTGALQAAQQAGTDTSMLAALMGQQNAATDMLQGQTTREVTPYLQTSVNDAADQALQGVYARYANSGRLGSMSFADQAGRGVTNAAAPILQQAAQADANRQQQAMGMLANISAQDMGRDVGLAQYQTQAQMADLGRQGQLAGMLAQLDNQGIGRDAQIAGQVANMENAGINRDMGAQQSIMAANQSDLARQAGIAGQLAGLSAEQARMAPMVEQINLNRMGLLGSIGDAQQQYNQAQLMGQQQQIAEQNAAQQQQLQNMLAAQGLGSNYLGQRSEYVDPNAMLKALTGGLVAGTGLIRSFG